MSIINELENTLSVTFNGIPILSNTVSTVLALSPTIVKSVDVVAGAKIGDILTYTVVITNLNLTAITNLPITDPLPDGCAYKIDTCKLNGSMVTPTYTSETNTLTYTIANIAALGVATLTFQVTITG